MASQVDPFETSWHATRLLSASADRGRAESLWSALVAENLPPRELWPERVYRLFEYPDSLNVAEQLLNGDGARGRDEATAIVCRGEAISYQELRQRVLSLAAGLIRLGVQPADRVVLQMPNCAEFVVSWLAIQWIGAIGVPIPPQYRRREVEHIVNHSGATMVMCAGDLADGIEAARPRFERPVAVVAGGVCDDPAPPPPAYAMAKDDPALITYITSASGPPKGVVHSPADLLATADTYARHVLRLSAADVCIGNTTLAWAFGLGALLVFPLRAGATTVLLDSSGPPLLAAVAALRATVLFCVPTMYRLLIQQPDVEAFDLSSLRCCVSAAERLPAAVAGEWRARTGLEILDGLGTTELGHIFISSRPGEVRAGTIGVPVPGYEARIVDEQFREMRRGRAGLLAVRGPTGCRYWRDADAQRHGVDHGWTLTGDICIERDDGFFVHERRADDLIVSAGYKVSPREVEGVLLEHPAVARAYVFSVADPVRGAVPRATVTLRPGVDPSTIGELLQQYLKRELAPYKCPRQIQLVEETDR